MREKEEVEEETLSLLFKMYFQFEMIKMCLFQPQFEFISMSLFDNFCIRLPLPRITNFVKSWKIVAEFDRPCFSKTLLIAMGG